MKNKLSYRIMPQDTVPAVFVLAFDLFIVFIAIIIAVLMRVNFRIPAHFNLTEVIIIFSSILIVRTSTFLIFRTYTSLIRYIGVKDIINLFKANIIGSGLLGIINLIMWIMNQKFAIPSSIIITEFLISVFIMIFYRLGIRFIYVNKNHSVKVHTNILVYGAGELGIITIRSINKDSKRKYHVIGFIDDDEKKTGKKINGIPIYAAKNLNEILSSNNIAHLVIAIENLNIEKQREITEICTANKVKVLLVPPISRWINGELTFKQIKKIRVEDLLGRPSINIKTNQIQKDLVDKIIFVTGAAGSIGSEIVRQLLNYDFKELVLIDNAETPMFFLEMELLQLAKGKKYTLYIRNICQQEAMEHLFEQYRPNLIFHAAAYKHVPLMENNPTQAVQNNVWGTKVLADLSVKYGAEKFVMISTDKAVNPTNVMGASKRIAEIYVQSLGNYAQTCKFITTRFGNVLGSNGSVIPILKKQIEQGGPITITHPEVTRFFMTIPEACQLVLQAGSIGNGGEIYIFDMGKSVKIYDLAKNMISLSGLELGKDIQIVFTGLRPGEKLYEELLTNEENTTVTQYDRIKIAKVTAYNFENIKNQIDDLINSIEKDDDMALVRKMKALVPEYKSQNSKYISLDDNFSQEKA